MVWLKINQNPLTHVNQGLRVCVLSLSTGGCTVVVGNRHILKYAQRVRSEVGFALEHDASATEVRKLALQGVDLLRPYGD